LNSKYWWSSIQGCGKGPGWWALQDGQFLDAWETQVLQKRWPQLSTIGLYKSLLQALHCNSEKASRLETEPLPSSCGEYWSCRASSSATSEALLAYSSGAIFPRRRCNCSQIRGRWTYDFWHTGQCDTVFVFMDLCTHQKQKRCPHASTTGLYASSKQIGQSNVLLPAIALARLLLSKLSVSVSASLSLRELENSLRTFYLSRAQKHKTDGNLWETQSLATTVVTTSFFRNLMMIPRQISRLRGSWCHVPYMDETR